MEKLEFLELVKAELVAIKKHATTEEIDKLDYFNFNPNSTFRCIYGQLGVGCRSSRAVNLIRKCCVKTISPKGDINNKTTEQLISLVNGPPTKTRISVSNLIYMSALEGYILTKGKINKNKAIFKYLKGGPDSPLPNL